VSESWLLTTSDLIYHFLFLGINRGVDQMPKAPSSVENLDFENMSDGQLREVIQRAKETLTARITRRIDEYQLLAREVGFEVTLTKLGEGASHRRQRSPDSPESDDRRRDVPAKFRNPDNPAEIWAGRGRKPKWVEEKLNQGRTLDDLLINPPAARESPP
jgi:DNA-binding protein H-NS